MRKQLTALFLVLFCLPAFLSASALPSASKGAKTVHIKSYTKKSGTVVQAYDRAAPRAKPKATPVLAKAAPKTAVTPAIKSPAVVKKSTAAVRASNGKIARNAAARTQFEKATGYPKGRPGYVIDHVVPLECGGLDAPSNMQWQTIADAKIKDKTERNCRR